MFTQPHLLVLVALVSGSSLPGQALLSSPPLSTSSSSVSSNVTLLLSSSDSSLKNDNVQGRLGTPQASRHDEISSPEEQSVHNKRLIEEYTNDYEISIDNDYSDSDQTLDIFYDPDSESYEDVHVYISDDDEEEEKIIQNNTLLVPPLQVPIDTTTIDPPPNQHQVQESNQSNPVNHRFNPFKLEESLNGSISGNKEHGKVEGGEAGQGQEEGEEEEVKDTFPNNKHIIDNVVNEKQSQSSISPSSISPTHKNFSTSITKQDAKKNKAIDRKVEAVAVSGEGEVVEEKEEGEEGELATTVHDNQKSKKKKKQKNKNSPAKSSKEQLKQTTQAIDELNNKKRDFQNSSSSINKSQISLTNNTDSEIDTPFEKEDLVQQPIPPVMDTSNNNHTLVITSGTPNTTVVIENKLPVSVLNSTIINATTTNQETSTTSSFFRLNIQATTTTVALISCISGLVLGTLLTSLICLCCCKCRRNRRKKRERSVKTEVSRNTECNQWTKPPSGMLSPAKLTRRQNAYAERTYEQLNFSLDAHNESKKLLHHSTSSTSTSQPITASESIQKQQIKAINTYPPLPELQDNNTNTNSSIITDIFPHPPQKTSTLNRNVSELMNNHHVVGHCPPRNKSAASTLSTGLTSNSNPIHKIDSGLRRNSDRSGGGSDNERVSNGGIQTAQYKQLGGVGPLAAPRSLFNTSSPDNKNKLHNYNNSNNSPSSSTGYTSNGGSVNTDPKVLSGSPAAIVNL